MTRFVQVSFTISLILFLLIPIHYEGTLKYMVKVEEIQYGEQTSGTNPGNG
jgi:hypothetical protein